MLLLESCMSIGFFRCRGCRHDPSVSTNWEEGSRAAAPGTTRQAEACFAVNPETLEWQCFSCERGGGPLEYVAALEGLTGAGSSERWKALAEHAGCDGSPERPGPMGAMRNERDPLKQLGTRTKKRAKATAGPTTAGAPQSPQLANEKIKAGPKRIRGS